MLAEVTARLASGEGPVAVDAERASGYRYGQRAYLVQLRRAGAGTMLVDPIACPDLSGIDAAVADAEAVLHAASQDLPCLAEIGFRPQRLFDTELAGRLLGYPRVALGTLVEEVLGFHLEKGHSAADWSARPLREELLRYAALDVEVLIELRDALAAELADQGKTEWARQEFEAVLAARPAPARPDPCGARRASTGCSPAAGSPWCASSGGQGQDRPDRRPVPAPCPARHGDRRGGQVLPGQPCPADQDQRVRRPSGPAAREGMAGRGGAGPGQRRPRAARDRRRSHTQRAAAGAPLGRRDPAAAARLAAARAVMAALAEENRLPGKTCYPPTRSAGSAGIPHSRATSRPWPRRSPGTARGRGRSS